jgi:hypothetical protein
MTFLAHSAPREGTNGPLPSETVLSLPDDIPCQRILLIRFDRPWRSTNPLVTRIVF